MQKTLIKLIITSLLVFPLQTTGAFNQSSAQTYLLSKPQSSWSTMALAASGATNIPSEHLKNVNANSAIGYTAPILAIAALNKNPRTFSQEDYVAKLKNFYQQNQIGDPALLNDDIFGVLALVSAAEAVTDPVIADAKNFLLNHQGADGGWSYAVNSSSDTNMTAAAILALLAAGVPASNNQIQNALTYVQSSQNSDGGFPYDPQSSYSTASDAASTAWVIWARNALNLDSVSAKTFLENHQTSPGFFEYQKNSGEDAFTPITTSYAVIALSGKKLPLQIFSQTQAPTFNVRIEGSQDTVCSAKVAGPTALDVVKNAALLCGFAYNIQNTSFGPYLNQINNDIASGLVGWLYLVNNALADVGADQYILQTNDQVLWYFGEFGWPPTRLTLSATQIPSNQTVTATVEFFQNNSWSPLADATVHFGAQTALTNAAGQVLLAPAVGYYQIFAAKAGHVRSQALLLQVGEPASATVQLAVNIQPGQVGGATTTPPVISFTVNPSALDFGTLNPGTSQSRELTLQNTGSVAIQVESIAGGDPVFVENLQIANVRWSNYQTSLTQDQEKTESVKLTVPLGYSSIGSKSGTLTFWAMAQ